jgi:hypothetical protein
VKANVTGSLILASGSAAPRAAALPPEWEALDAMHAVTVTDRNSMAQTLRFGGAFPDGADPGAYELPPPPPEGIFDARFSGDRAAALLSPAGVSAAVTVRGAKYPLTITIAPGAADGASRRAFDLIDPLSGRTIASNIGPETPFLLRDPAVTSFAVRLAADAALPERFALNQNYPNPFNPSTAISFDLPSPSAVTVRVYNVLGQAVATLADRDAFAAGRHTLEFRADALGSGIYFCRLDAVGTDGISHTFSTKMLLLK